MSPPVVRLGARHRRLLHGGFALLWVSGALWLMFHYFFQTNGEFGPAQHPLEIWWLRLHGLMAMLALALVGSLAPNHIRLAWSRRRNLSTGLPMLGLAVWLAATGYALYYFSSDANENWLPLLHWSVGLALPASLIAHVRRGRKRVSRVTSPSRHAPESMIQPSYPPASQQART
jgi:hypothetical protein